MGELFAKNIDCVLCEEIFSPVIKPEEDETSYRLNCSMCANWLLVSITNPVYVTLRRVLKLEGEALALAFQTVLANCPCSGQFNVHQRILRPLFSQQTLCRSSSIYDAICWEIPIARSREQNREKYDWDSKGNLRTYSIPGSYRAPGETRSSSVGSFWLTCQKNASVKVSVISR